MDAVVAVVYLFLSLLLKHKHARTIETPHRFIVKSDEPFSITSDSSEDEGKPEKAAAEEEEENVEMLAIESESL